MQGQTALIHTVLLNKPEFIQFLEQEKKVRDKSGKTALWYACFNNNVACAKQLMEEVAVADDEFQIPLMIAKEKNC